MIDPIVEEVRATRARLAARFDYDLSRIIDDAIARENATRELIPNPLPETATAKMDHPETVGASNP